MTGDSDTSLNVTALGSHEVKEKRVTAGVDGDQIGHQTQPTLEPQKLEERKRKLEDEAAAAFVEAKRRERAAAPPAKTDKRNQGSVIAVVVIVGVLLLLVVGFIVLMWRLGKSELEVKKHILDLVDR
jgi:hypothetical protein